MIYNKLTKVKYTVMLILLTSLLSSCSLFDKDIRQDKKMHQYRVRLSCISDSLLTSKDKIKLYRELLSTAEVDSDLITPRKKNNLLSDMCNFFGAEFYLINKPDSALLYYNKSIDYNGTSYKSYYNRALLYQEMGGDSLAIQDYTQSILLNSGFTDAYYNRALAHVRNSDYKSALSDYTFCTNRKPDYLAEVYFNRAFVYQKLENTTEALKDYDSVLAIEPLNSNALMNKIEILLLDGKQEEALVVYKEKIISLPIDTLIKQEIHERIENYKLDDSQHSKNEE